MTATSRLLARNSALNLLGQVAPAVAALVSIPWLIRGLGADRIGVLYVAWAAIGYFGLVDLGLSRALTHAVATRLGAESEDELAPVGWTALLLMFLLGVLGALVLALSTPWLVGHLLRIPPGLEAESRTSFYLLALSLPFVISAAGLRGIMEAHQDFGLVTALRVPLGVFSYVGPLAILPVSHRLDVVIGVLVFGRFAGWVAHVIVAWRRYAFLRESVKIHRHMVAPLLRVGGWMTVSNVVSPLMTYLDRFLIGVLLPVAAVAYYVTPYEAVMRLLIIPSAIAGVFFPAFAESFARDKRRSARLLDKSIRAIALSIFPAALVLVTLATEILRAWVGPEFARVGAPVLQWLAVGVLINGIGFALFTFMQGVGRADVTGKLNLMELPFYAASIWVLATTVGLTGVAIAWTIRVLVDTCALMMFARARLGAEKHVLHAPVLLWASMGSALLIGASLSNTSARLGFVVTALLVYLPFAWFGLITRQERESVVELVRSISAVKRSAGDAA